MSKSSHRQIMLGIVESMDVYDATRSHEQPPAALLLTSANARRLARILLTSIAALLSVCAVTVLLQV